MTQKNSSADAMSDASAGRSALDERCQGSAVALEILVYPIQPFALCRSDEPRGGKRGFGSAIAHEPLDVRRRAHPKRRAPELVRPHGLEHAVHGTSRHHRGLGAR